MKRRVVVTGIGAISPNGIGREVFWEATKQGKSGIGLIERFNTEGLAVRIAGEVPSFDEAAYVSPKDRQHVSRVVPLAIAATYEALQDAGLDYCAMPAWRMYVHTESVALFVPAREGYRRGLARRPSGQFQQGMTRMPGGPPVRRCAASRRQQKGW